MGFGLFFAFFLSLAFVTPSVLSEPTDNLPIYAIVASSLDTRNDFSFQSISPEGVTTFISNRTDVGGLLPSECAWLAHEDAMLTLSLSYSPLGGELSLIDRSGKLQQSWVYLWAVFTAVEYDVATKQAFVMASIIKQSDASHSSLALNPVELYAVDTQQGELTKVLPIVGIVQEGISTYCPKGHIFFATLQTNGLTPNLIRIDTLNKKLLSNITLADDVMQLLWDHTTATMYAWTADSRSAGILVTIDIETGRRVQTILTLENLSPNTNSGSACVLDVNTKQMYCHLLDLTPRRVLPNWVVIDVTTGKYSQRQLSAYPIDLALA